MIADQLAAAVADARTIPNLDNLARLLWRGVAEGHIPDHDATALDTALQARRLALQASRASGSPVIRKPVSAPRRPVSVDRQRSIERRRRLAFSGAVPGTVASSFTVGEIAVLAVIGREVQRRGRCEHPVEKIAGLAGVCRTVAQGTLRRARQAGLLAVVERRYRGRRSDTNVVTVISREWATWLRLRGRAQKSERHEIQEYSKGSLLGEKPQSSPDALLRSWSVRLKVMDLMSLNTADPDHEHGDRQDLQR
jgi:hypothetical protein